MPIAVLLIVLVVGSLIFHFMSPWTFTPLASNWSQIDATINIPTYRFSDPAELIESGLQEAFNETNVCIVEWPERAGSLLPTADIDVSLAITDGARSALLTAHTEKGKSCLHQLET